jgi:hypothetical protein
MLRQSSIGAIALVLAMLASAGGNAADDAGKYPDWSGGWARMGGGSYDPVDPNNKVPLTPEYQAKWDAAIATQAKTGVSNNPVERCFAPGMPRTMIVIDPMEIIITPKTTYMLVSYMMEQRRIYTDGRSWPKEGTAEPSFSGYSIGKWEDTDGDGKYDTLNIETRLIKGPRVYDPRGMPFHEDNKTVVKESISLDKKNPELMNNVITVEDHALTRPWTVPRQYKHVKNPVWSEYICGENNNWVFLGDQGYYLSPDGLLMPTVKGQPAPDLRYFTQPEK